MAACRFLTKAVSGYSVRASAGWRNSPGKRSVVPYTSSAGEQSGPTLQDERMPSSTIGSSDIQVGFVVRALSEALSCRCKRSTIPFACGWYAVVLLCEMPSSLLHSVHSEEVN